METGKPRASSFRVELADGLAGLPHDEEVPAVRIVARVLALAVVLAMVMTAAGCWNSGKQTPFSSEYQAMTLKEAPSTLQAHFDKIKAAPGLTVLQEGGKTYLLLAGGRVEEQGLGVEVLAVQVPQKDDKAREVRLIARLMKTAGADAYPYPYTVLVFDGTPDYKFIARLATRTGELDLIGTLLTDR